ncbi:MAG: hypothetical protein RLZZ611_588 [Cyanobacteriota bacterium]|jgi:HlyD family type I secretion membrane fusion protein
MEHSIVKANAGALVVAEVDQFLPPPGPWARSIGQRVLVASGVILLASCVLPFEQTVRAKGVVRPSGDNTLIQSDQPGRIARVMVRANQTVVAHQILAVLDRHPLEGRQRQLEQELRQVQTQRLNTRAQEQQLQAELLSNQLLNRAAVDMSRGDVAKANASLRFANTEMTRYRELAKVGAVPQLLSQEKTANFLIMTSELRQARYGVAQQQAKLLVERARLFQQRNGLQSQLAEQERQTLGLSRELADVKRILANTAVRAPMAATVVRTTLNHVGQVVNAGEVIAELAPTHAPLLVKALVPAKDVAAVRPQQKTYLRVGACPYSRFGLLTGRIKQVAPDTMAAPAGAAAASGGGPFYEVTIQPDRRELGKGQERCALRIGMDLQADVMTKRTTIMGFLFSKLRLMAQS